MEKAKIFSNGGSQAIRIPKNFRLKGKHVRIEKIGDGIVILPEKDSWERLDASVKLFTEDYVEYLDEVQRLRKKK